MWVLSQRYSRPWPLPCPQSLSGGQSAGPRRSRLQLRIVWLMFALTLALPGCTSLGQPTSNQAATTLPIRPVLNSLKIMDEGGIMMDKHGAAELLLYIEALERAAGMVRQ